MALTEYIKNSWAAGYPILPDKVNHMEDGIAGGGGILVVNVTAEDVSNCDGEGSDGIRYTFDHTWQEMHDAIEAETIVFLRIELIDGGHACDFVKEANSYHLNLITSSGEAYDFDSPNSNECLVCDGIK